MAMETADLVADLSAQAAWRERMLQMEQAKLSELRQVRELLQQLVGMQQIFGAGLAQAHEQQLAALTAIHDELVEQGGYEDEEDEIDAEGRPQNVGNRIVREVGALANTGG